MADITILMAVYNGARFLSAQLDSIAAQEDRDWRLLAGDDGSTDGSQALLRGFADRHPGRVRLVDGPRKGAGAHFRALLALAPDDVAGAAFADQDDVWFPDKLTRARAALAKVPVGTPALYGARTLLTDAALQPLGTSPHRPQPPLFRNALVQNFAGGNTMVMNAAALRLLQAADAEAPPVDLHDWWAYQIVSGAGGTVLYDPAPCLAYRQHDANEIGAPRGVRGALARVGAMVSGLSAARRRGQLPALHASAHRFTAENRASLALFAEALAAPGGARQLRLLRQSGVYRQDRGGDTILRLAAVLGRF